MTIALAATFAGCARDIEHDPDRAGRAAVDFIRVAFIEDNLPEAYRLMAPAGRRYIPIDKFIQTMKTIHPRSRPTRVTATDYSPVPSEKAIYVYLASSNGEEQFSYRITLDGTAASGYKVLKIERGSGFFDLQFDKSKFSQPIGSGN